MITEALVKSVTFNDNKLEIHLKDGRKVHLVFAELLCNQINCPLSVIFLKCICCLAGQNRSYCCSCWPGAQR